MPIPYALCLLGPRARPASKSLQQFLEAETADVRCLAAEVLWWADRNLGGADALGAEFRGADVERRRRAAAAVETMLGYRHRGKAGPMGLESLNQIQVTKLTRRWRGADWDESLTALAREMGFTDEIQEEIICGRAKHLRLAPGEQIEVLDLVGKGGFVQPDVASAVAEGLTSPHPRVRQKAAEVLQTFGPVAKGAVPALVNALKDDDLDARYAAGQALKAVDPEAAKKALVP